MNDVLILDRYDITFGDNVEYNDELGVYYINITFDNLSNTTFVDITSQLEDSSIFYMSQKRFSALGWRVINLTLIIEAIDVSTMTVK